MVVGYCLCLCTSYINFTEVSSPPHKNIVSAKSSVMCLLIFCQFPVMVSGGDDGGGNYDDGYYDGGGGDYVEIGLLLLMMVMVMMRRCC